MSQDQYTVVVTGGAGFIGSHLCERLHGEGFKVVNIDNFNDYYCPSIKHDNIRSISNSDNYFACAGDIRDIAYLDHVFAVHKPDVVVHLAAMAGVQPSLENPGLYYDVNVNGTLQLLLSCVKSSVAKIVFASSSSVYGNNQTPFKENDNTDFSVSPYASSKKAGEILCHVYHHLHNISIHCLRFFTVVGPRQRPDLAVHKFVKAILSGQPVQLRGDLNSSRDYTSVYDTVDGIMGSIHRLLNKKKPEYEIYNLGNSYPVSLGDMLRTIEEVLEKKADVEYVDFMKGDVDSTFADISLAYSDLGYEPKRSFEDAVISFVDWYKSF